MVDELAGRLKEFPGATNRTRCFTHIINLVVKGIMYQFDVPSKKSGAFTDERAEAYHMIAGDIEMDELLTQVESENSQEDKDGPLHDNDKGWIDEWDNMAEEDVDKLEDSMRPLQYLLTKVSGRKCCKVFANQLTRRRFANLRSQSRTHLQLSFLSGTAFLMTFHSRNG